MKRLFILQMMAVTCFFSPKLYAQTVNFMGVELLGRPTNSSISVNVVANQALDAYFEYGTSPGNYTSQTNVVSYSANEPIEVIMTGLQSNTKYYYRMVYRETGTISWTQRAEHSFTTQRSSGSTFTFDITSDSHVHIVLGDSATWHRTLTNVANDNPDFLIDCGDTFNMDTTTSGASADSSYIYQRKAAFFGVVSPSVPIFLAVGNHEEEEGWHLNDNNDHSQTQPVWATNAQKKYFLNPVPDNFYSGDNNTHSSLDGDHLREDYYAWTWGNALFVVIDPFWFTTAKPFIGNTGGGEPGTSDGDRWHWTLGDEQYNWLRQTLQNSNATYKFLFMHHMTGGTSDYIRGGAYAAPYCEWGGYNEDGITYGFTTRRPTWPTTIHQLLIDTHVSAVFHGHDHQYAYEMRDGIVYQSLPAAGFSGNGFNVYNQTNPLTTRALPSGGHLRVTINPTQATVDYISSNTATNTQVLYSYTIDAAANGPLPVEMKSFTLETENNKKVILKWETASEFQNKQFIVQRSIRNSGDFKDIGKVAATNSSQGSSYSFIDEPGLSGDFLYRIIQEDINGKQTYSEARLAILNSGKYLRITDNGRNWQFQSTELVNYSLMDISGRVIEKGSFNGTKIITKPSEGSVYILRTECDGKVLTKKLR